MNFFKRAFDFIHIDKYISIIFLLLTPSEGVAEGVRRRLRWFGHVERMGGDTWVSACRGIEVEGPRGRGRGRKTWQECVEDDMRRLGVRREAAQDRAVWRGAICGQPSDPRKRGQRTRTDVKR